MNLETKITIYKFTPQVFTLTQLAYKWKEERYSIVYCSSLPIYEKTNPDYCT